MYGFLRTLNQLLKSDDRVDYFLDAFQVCTLITFFFDFFVSMSWLMTSSAN